MKGTTDGEFDALDPPTDKEGKPVRQIPKMESGACECDGSHLIGSLRHKLVVKGDVFTTGLCWDANTQS